MLMVKFNQGAQLLRWAPVDRSGRVRVVTGATYTIVDLREPEESDRRVLVASTLAGIGAVDTKTSDPAGPSQRDPRMLTLNTAADVELGCTYILLSAVSALSTSIKPVVITGRDIQIGRDLQQDFEDGSIFQSVEIEATFPAADANDELRLRNGGGPFQLTFTYELDAMQHVVPVAVWMSRYGIPPFVTVDEMFQHNTAAAQRFGPDNPPEEAIAAGTDEVLSRIEAAGRPWDLARTNINARMAIRKFALATLHINSTAPDDLERAQMWTAQAEAHVGHLLEGRPPTRTARVHEVTDRAPPGSDMRSTGGIIQRS